MARFLLCPPAMICKLKTATIVGIEAREVVVEVDISRGMPGFYLVGLPLGAVKEGGVRIRGAISNSGYTLGPARVTVNLAPADLRKEGAAFDLPIALGVLAAKGQISAPRDDLLIAGELSLDGEVKPIRGVLPLASAARQLGLAGVVVPRANAAEAAMVEGVTVYGVTSLGQAASFVSGEVSLLPTPSVSVACEGQSEPVDFSEVHGQLTARRAAEVAAAGGHNLMLVGPPGSGKTMIARRMSTILPPMTEREALEATAIHSVAGLLNDRPLLAARPFRAPHHTCSSGGLVGGGPNPRPGEVSLAHHGVLFLDELPEFQRACLEALRQPIEDRHVTIVRARQAVTYPASFMLVAAMNPCPCGYRGSAARTCTCGEREARRYTSRVSGPLLDRFDLLVHAEPVAPSTILEARGAVESSSAIRARVVASRERQARRFARAGIYCNAQMNARQLRRWAQIPPAARALLLRFAEVHQLSGRSLHRACRVARTIADLQDSEAISEEHVGLALTLQQSRWIR